MMTRVVMLMEARGRDKKGNDEGSEWKMNRDRSWRNAIVLLQRKAKRATGGTLLYQSGFRHGRSTMDAGLKQFSHKKSLSRKRSSCGNVCGRRKSIWLTVKEGIMIKLYKTGIQGRLFNWMKNFLMDQTNRVRVGNEMSEEFKVENGTLQGSVISPILFNIMISDMINKTEEEYRMSLFADDGAIRKRDNDLTFIFKQM